MRLRNTAARQDIRPEGTVLVVDDDPDHRRLLRLRLERMNYRVSEACDGREALRRAAEVRYDLCLLDIRMPGLDGVDTLRRLRFVAPGMRVVFVTGTSDDATFARALAPGTQPDGFLSKPVAADALERCVDVVLRKHGRFLRVL